MKKEVLEYLAVGLASAFGGMLRLGVARIFTWSAFPIGTMLINITGSLFLGWFLTTINDRVLAGQFNEYFRLAIGVGFVGAYTTFSTYMFESDKMLQEGAGFRAIFYLLGSLLVGLLAVRCGVILASRPD
jgi:CrcB protein